MFYQELKKKAIEALKSGNDFNKTLLRTVVGEVDRTNKTDDATVRQVIKKMITNNNEIRKVAPDNQKAAQENTLLFSLLDNCLSAEQVETFLQEHKDTLRSARNEGAAIGMANKLLKSSGNDYFGDDVVVAVRKLRT